jgi:hypothetical protein
MNREIFICNVVEHFGYLVLHCLVRHTNCKLVIKNVSDKMQLSQTIKIISMKLFNLIINSFQGEPEKKDDLKNKKTPRN